MPAPRHITIVGAGISGLSTAYYLSEIVPSTTEILLLESSPFTGGWIRSRRLVPSSNSSAGTYEDRLSPDSGILFELGPRSLRPTGASGTVLLSLVKQLGLTSPDNLIGVSRDSSSAKNRYIYYDSKIQKIPSSMTEFLYRRPSIMQTVASAVLKEPFVEPRTTPLIDTSGFSELVVPDPEDDESVYDFFSRRFNPHIAQNLVGSMVHGIYAADARDLSLRSTMPLFYKLEKVYGSVIKGMMLGGGRMESMRDRGIRWRAMGDDHEFFGDMANNSVYSFIGGVEEIPYSLLHALRKKKNAKIIHGEKVIGISGFKNESNDGRLNVKTEGGGYYDSDLVISAVPSHILDSLLDISLPNLSYNPAVTVSVVNLAYKQPRESLFPYDGFGYLTPPPLNRTGPIDGTGVLGVVFDSNAVPGQDKGQYENWTKLTVMISGELQARTKLVNLDPVEVALRTVDHHLGITTPPSLVHSAVHKSCIPSYTLGHYGRMAELHRAIIEKTKGKLAVVGSSYWGVSVGDCIKSAKELVEDMTNYGILSESGREIITGLNRTEKNREVGAWMGLKDGVRKGNTITIARS